MTADEIAAALKLVREETDLNSKSLLLAGLVSELFRERGVKSHGGSKSWGIEGLWIDLLGEIDYRSNKELSRFDTPHGEVRLIPVEDALVGRVYAARKYCNGYDEKDDDCAKKLMAGVLTGRIPIDWDEAYRVAACSKYNCAPEFNAVKAEVEAELEKSKS